MAARRLIIVMLILLGISTLLAAALPDRVRDAEDEQTASETTGTATDTTGTATAEAGDQKPAKSSQKYLTLDADKRKIQVIPLDAGDVLNLTVVSSTDDLVDLQDLGYVGVVGPDIPATFSIFADRPGVYGIRLVEAARTVGRIEVTEPDG